jgi:ribonuclease BN (tRNA processing enzyme)
VRLTIVGKSPSWPDAGGACSGYLIEHDGFRLLLECGPGVFAKVRELIDYLTLDAVLVTHMHGDHFLDLIPYSYALTYSPRQHDGSPVRPQLHVPPGGVATICAIAAACAGNDLVESAFAVREYDRAGVLRVGPLTVRFAEVPHFVPTHAVDITAGDGSRLTFSADCGPNEALVALAENTALLLVEATLADTEPDQSGGHMTCRQAAEHAQRARAGRVVLTHFSDEYDAGAVLAGAASSFAGPIDLARPGDVYTLDRASRPTPHA